MVSSDVRGPQSAASGLSPIWWSYKRILINFLPESGLGYQDPFGGIFEMFG
jgi:hypothetical protein